MAAFGILAALRERERTGLGQLVDVSMFDGALSWLALVAARYLVRGRGAGARHARAGGRAHLLPALCLQGRLGHARRARARSSGRRGAPASEREDLVEKQFEAPGLGRARRGGADLHGAHARGMARVRLEPRLLPRAGARPGRGARLGARARARDGGGGRPARYRRSSPARACRSSSRARRGRRPVPGPRSGEHTAEVLAALGYDEDEIAALEEAGAVAGPAEAGARGSFMG